MGCLIIKKVWMKYDNIMMMKLNERVWERLKSDNDDLDEDLKQRRRITRNEWWDNKDDKIWMMMRQ